MTADYAARIRTLAARHNREWQLLVEDMDRERIECSPRGHSDQTSFGSTTHVEHDMWGHCRIESCPRFQPRQHAEAEEHA